MVEIERDIEEELLGEDSLVPRRKSNGISHHYQYHHTEFDSEGPIDGPVEEEICPRVEFEQDEVVIGSDFGGSHQHEIEDAIGQSEGSETPNELSRMESQVVSDGSTPKSSLETDLKYLEIHENTTTCSTAAAKTSNGDHGIAVNGYSNGTVKPDEFTVLEQELDVERVLNKQETHDLFCPNCNSCITKRVILRPRKRKIQELSPISIPEPVQDPSPQEPEIESNEDTERGAFRCLSCFSIFIPIGRGFKLFLFGDRGLKETDRDAPQLTPSDAPSEVEPGTVNEQHVGVVTAQEQSPHHSQPELLPEQGWKPSLPPPGEQETSVAVDPDTKPQLAKVESMTLPAEQTLLTKLEVTDENKVTVDEQDRLQIHIQSDARAVPSRIYPQKDVRGIEPVDPVTDEHKLTVDEQKGLQIQIQSDALAAPTRIDPHKDVTGVEPVDSGNQVVVSVVQEADQTVVSVTVPTEPQLPPVPNTSSVPSTAPAAGAVTDGVDPQIDIIKSIIYGGLLESIASLSVVTAAAGANAKTLNILALGAANMFGGLFILAHNLRVLKHENSDERYEEVLGRPGHFTFHSIVAVLSYIVFGLLPPVIYAFTFRESDNRDYKLIVVATASLLCIILLALGKSYTKTPPKEYMKTLVYYVSLWIMVCGVSYVAGDLFDFLLQKLGWFESSSSVAMPVGEFRAVKVPWASS